jgi:hypothetical protein
MDWHFHTNKLNKEMQSLSWNDLMKKQYKPESYKTHKVDAAKNHGAYCIVCYEEFVSYFDQDEEDWLFIDIIDFGHNMYTHSKCF